MGESPLPFFRQLLKWKVFFAARHPLEEQACRQLSFPRGGVFCRRPASG
jgi:hypothetical protein